jgi:hypothetical protein
MKLARPDVFHPRIVLAGCPGLIAGDPDDAGLVAALRHRGLHAHWLAWDDPETLRADLVILRAARDHAERLAEFLVWTTAVRNLLNPPAVVAWNARPRYLGDLADRGVPTVRVRAPGADETVLIFIGGTPSHAFTQGTDLVRCEPDFEVWDAGSAALAAAAAQVGVDVGELLYARVHLVDGRLLAMDLVDPPLGWAHLDAETRDGAERGFALAVESACERLGLGPFSRSFPE